MDLLKCLAVFAVLVFGTEGVEDGMDRVRVVCEAVKGVKIYRDLVVLWMRSGGNGREEDGAEKEALEKHSDGVWRRWASERPNPQESVLIRGGECRRGRRVFLGAEHTGRKKVGISALYDRAEESHQLSPPPSRIDKPLQPYWRRQKHNLDPSGLVVYRAASPSD